ncbi:AraC family transcriptional regulator [Rhizobium sp. L1K21]|uniref:AraC family transcriptional regulator n=1 Tax=Rhizobium sp. L1K21 TaxID=2954933 RepID=UPI0020935640|nr:AraC family transcriptional regulator [Rhizobium sp. L1K21]MCO6188561.1 AraC family transcriptional regulator [Rhizobium sp. L1K21]
MAPTNFKIVRCMPGIEAVWADTRHAFGRHTHDQFGIGVISRGAQTSMSGRGHVEAEAGNVITVNPGEVHDGLPVDDAGRAWRMLYFDVGVLQGFFDGLTEGATNGLELAHPVMRDPATAAEFLSLFRAMTGASNGDSELEANESLCLLLSRLIEHRSITERPAVPRSIARARERIDDDPSAPLKLEDLARISGISQFQLVRGFARLFGLTPHAYLVQQRLFRVRQLINDGVGLAEAATAAGFADQSHMTRLFVRAYGLSPGRYAAAIG